MCSSSRSPALGLTGVNGTPASSAPTAATHVSRRDSANTATRSRPATVPATAAAAPPSSAYVRDRSPKRMASLSEASASGGSSSLMAAILPTGGAGCAHLAHPAPGPEGEGSAHGVLDLVDETVAVAGDDAGRLLGQPGRLAQLPGDL